jgi:hypothetical protein
LTVSPFQAISISYEGEGLPAFGFLNGTVQELDEIPSTIMLNKTKATLNCSSGFMGIGLQFQQPFYGIVYADYDRNRLESIFSKKLSPYALAGINLTTNSSTNKDDTTRQRRCAKTKKFSLKLAH